MRNRHSIISKQIFDCEVRFLLSETSILWIHTLYEIAGIFLAIGVVVTVIQLRLLKLDINTRSKRAAAEQSINYLDMYADKVLNINGHSSKPTGVAAYKVKLKETKNDVNLDADGSKYFDIHFKTHGFDHPLDDVSSDEFQDAFWRINAGVVVALNYLEIYSIAMVKGVASEEIAFAPTSAHFCQFVKENYLGICKIRQNVPYENVVKLFNMWNSRIEKIDEEKEHKKLLLEARAKKEAIAVLSEQSKGIKPL